MRPLQIVSTILALVFIFSTKANEARKSPESSINRARVPPSGSNPFSYVPPNPRPSVKTAKPVNTRKPNLPRDTNLYNGDEWITQGFPEYNIHRANVPPTGPNPFTHVPPSVKTAKPVTTRKPNVADKSMLNKGEEWIKEGFTENTINRAPVPPSGPNPFTHVPQNPRPSVKSSKTRKPNIDSEDILSKGKEWINHKFPGSKTINRAHVPPSGANPFSYVPPNPRPSVKRDSTKPSVHGENSSDEGKDGEKHKSTEHRY